MKNFSIQFLVGFFVCASAVSACPLIEEAIDFNCDGKLRIAFTGDSITKGVGDERDLGGFPGRLERQLNVVVENVGVAGASAARLLRDFKKNIDKGKVTTRRTKELDYLFITVGTNDYWDYRNRGRPISLTLRNIRRLKKYLEEKLEEKWEVAPHIIVSTLPPTRRGFQQPFINSVNKLLKSRKRKLNVRVPFDHLSSGIIGEDDLHPNGKGYARMAQVARRVFRGVAQKQVEQLRSDEDEDGLYDELEELKFLTDPTLSDTDGDTLLDGDEVFTYETNPVNADTDGDESDDGEEIAAETDPNDPDDPPAEE